MWFIRLMPQRTRKQTWNHRYGDNRKMATGFSQLFYIQQMTWHHQRSASLWLVRQEGANNNTGSLPSCHWNFWNDHWWHDLLQLWLDVVCLDICLFCIRGCDIYDCCSFNTSLCFYSAFILPSVLWRCWLGGSKGIRPVKNWVVGYWRGCLTGARCRLAYGPADATATHCLLLQ